MEIKVLGTGCAGCKALHQRVIEAVAELGIDATVIKEEDLQSIIAYNIVALPGLVIDGKVVSAGKKLSNSEIKELINKKLNDK